MTLANPAVPDVEVAQLRVVVVDELVALSRVGLSRECGVELRLELVDRLHGGLRPGVPFTARPVREASNGAQPRSMDHVDVFSGMSSCSRKTY